MRPSAPIAARPSAALRARKLARAGFTLIEILAVILIIGILATILITNLGTAEEVASISNTKRQLEMIEGALKVFSNEEGDAPRSSFTSEQGVANDGTNVGVEALVVALFSEGRDGGDLSDLADKLVNVDGDSSSKNLTDFGTRELLEIPDDWGNPIAYIHRRDYEAKGRMYLTVDPITGEEIFSSPVAFKNATTGRFYMHKDFQLISAGPDATFGTDDDIANFDRD